LEWVPAKHNVISPKGGAQMGAQASKEEILKRVQQRGGTYGEAVYGNCAQSTIFALQKKEHY